MTDREKVIFDIERCICHVPDACRDCSKYGGIYEQRCMEHLMADALALLREQEPVKTEPVRFRVCRAGSGNYPFWDCVCDGCGFKTSMAHTDWRFCPMCGKAVKWE